MNKKIITNITQNRLYLGLLITICICFSGTGVYFHNDISNYISTPTDQLRAQLLDIQGQWPDIQAETLGKYLPQKINSELRRSALQKALPLNFDRNQLLATLEEISLQNEVNINQVSFAKETEQENYRQLTLALQLTGPRQNLLDFLAAMEKQDHNSSLPLLHITDLALNHDEMTNIVPLLSVGGNEKEARWLLEVQAETYARN